MMMNFGKEGVSSISSNFGGLYHVLNNKQQKQRFLICDDTEWAIASASDGFMHGVGNHGGQ